MSDQQDATSKLTGANDMAAHRYETLRRLRFASEHMMSVLLDLQRARRRVADSGGTISGVTTQTIQELVDQINELRTKLDETKSKL